MHSEKATFYDDKDLDGVSKPPGWLFLAEDGDRLGHSCMYVCMVLDLKFMYIFVYVCMIYVVFMYLYM